MQEQTTASGVIFAEVATWDGVSAKRGTRGELSFTVGRREIGHLHGDRVAHFGFPKPLWLNLLTSRRIGRHPLDRAGLGERRIRTAADVQDVIELFRLNYERALARRTGAEAGVDGAV